MNRTLFEQPAVLAPPTLRPAATAAEAARLQALDPSDYWLEIARELIWERPPHVGLEGDFNDFRYFPGAFANVSVNCLDRWPAERVALRYEREDGLQETWTYGQLTDATARFAAALEDMGVVKGDRIAIYAGNVPEAFIAIQACYRIGVIYTVIFSGFSAVPVRDRLEDAAPKAVIVTDATLRRGNVIALKATLDEAMRGLHIPIVIVARRVDPQFPLRAGEFDFHDLIERTERRAAPVAIEANEPGFLIYTSGTSSKPKGLVHSGIGFLVATYANVKWSMALCEEDVYWCTADVGWLALPVFAVVGGLANGGTHVIFEGSIDTPSLSRAYEIIERYGVTKLFSAPTVLRMLRRAGDALLEGHDLRSLSLITLVGEPLDQETWLWARDRMGGGNLYINNTYGQTETATTWASCIVGATPTKPGSCGHTMPGFEARVLRENGDVASPGELGALALRRPWPSLARTMWRDHARYVDIYLRPFPGYYYTADAAAFDVDGQLWVTGRIDDVINVAGHRIGTMELEAALLTHPAISEAAVVPQSDELKGLVPVAFVVLRAGHGDSAGLRADLSQRVVDAVGAIARLARVIVTPMVPRTRSGKIMRRVLRDLLTEEAPGGDLSSLENPEAVEVVRQRVLED